MPSKRPRTEPYIQLHKDGSLWAKGRTLGGTPTGYWEWFRKDGTKLRSGHFDDGRQTGEWTTYDSKGQVYKVTNMKPAPGPKAARAKPATAKKKSAAPRKSAARKE